MGFIREAVHVGESGALWTAHFGALSSNPEESRGEVALDSDESLQSYTVMDGFTDRNHSSNTETRLELLGSWSSAGFFYDTLMPVWRETEPNTETRTRPHTQVPSMEPLGFLGILQRSLAVAAGDVYRNSSPRLIRYPFAHKGELMYLALVDHRLDKKRQQRYIVEELVSPGATIHRLGYRIFDGSGGLVQRFRVWTELPAGAVARQAPPVFPVEFEFKAKSFLELRAVRVTASSPEYSTTRR